MRENFTCLLGAALWIVALISPARADLLPPGGKWVSHVVQFENLGDHKDYVFYIYPRDLGRGQPGNSSVRIGADGRASISGLNPLAVAEAGGIFLVAVPKPLVDAAPAADDAWFSGETEGVLKTKLAGGANRTGAPDDPDDIVDRYRVSLADGLQLTFVDQIRPAAADPKPAPTGSENSDSVDLRLLIGGIALAVAIAGAGLALIRCRGCCESRAAPESDQ